MNLNILTSGLITSKFGIRPALMCATRKDLSKHSVVRIVSDNASGWIGIANGNLITGAKCQRGEETLNGFEALSVFIKLENGQFDLIQMDSRLLGDELAQSIGINIDELLDKLRASPELPTIEILRKCKRIELTELSKETLPAPPQSSVATSETTSSTTDSALPDIDDEDWDLGDEGVIESLERQTKKDDNMVVYTSDNSSANTLVHNVGSLLDDAPTAAEAATAKTDVEASKTAAANLKASEASSSKSSVEATNEESEKKVSFLDSLAQAWGNVGAKKSTTEAKKPVDKKSTKEIDAVPSAKITWEPTLAEEAPVLKRTEPEAPETIVVRRNQEPTIELTPVAKRKTSEIALPSDAALTEAKDEIDSATSAPDAVAAKNEADIKPSAQTAEEAPKSDTAEIEVRFGKLSQMQDAAFEVPTLDTVSEPKSGFVIVSPEDQSRALEAPYEAPPQARRQSGEQSTADNDRLGAQLRAELQEFVRQKFGVEDGTFQKLDLEDSKDYQQSLVLRDLENAISGKAKEDEASSTPSPAPKTEKTPAEQPANQSTFDKLKSQAMTQSMQVSQLTSEVQRPKSASLNVSGSSSSSKAEDERESSRNIFVEQVRKSVEVDARSFVSTAQVEDKKLELSILKDKRFRNFIVVGSSVGIVFAGIFFVFFSAQRQSNLGAASEKLVAGDYKAAKEAYEAILASNPQSWEAHLGHALSVPTDYKTQVKDYKKVLEVRPNEFSAATAITKSYFELKEYGKAIEAADLAFKLKPNVTSLMIKADSLMHLSRFDTAAQVLEQALGMEDANKGEIYHQLAHCYHNTNEAAKESDCLYKAFLCEPKNVKFVKELALNSIARGDQKKSREFLNKALVLSPGDGELHYQNALMIKDKNPDAAIEELTKAIEHDYAKPEAFGERGMLYFQKQLWGPAKPDLEEALSKKPTAKLQKTLDLTDKAIALAKSRAGKRTLKDANDYADTPLTATELSGDYVGRAYEQLKAGNNGYAIRVLRAAVKMNANDARARRYLANALYNAGDYVGASTQYAYASAQGLSAEEQYYFGRALNKSNRLENAIKVLQNLVTQQPGFTKARVELIKAYALAGFTDHAREECKIGMQQARNQTEYAEFKSLLP